MVQLRIQLALSFPGLFFHLLVDINSGELCFFSMGSMNSYLRLYSVPWCTVAILVARQTFNERQQRLVQMAGAWELPSLPFFI